MTKQSYTKNSATNDNSTNKVKQTKIENSSVWRLARGRQMRFENAAKIIGIINATPDSFSDGGDFLDPNKAVAQALRMVDEGADMIDIGGESTRPSAPSIKQNVELQRVLPIITKIRSHSDVPISIDTSKAFVARAAIEAGADVVNDVSSGENDSAMLDFWSSAASLGCGILLMHKRGMPTDMQNNPNYSDAPREIASYLRARTVLSVTRGVERERLAIDPGIGFGKTPTHNWQILANLRIFAEFDLPLMLGVSRKSFLGKLLEVEEAKSRDSATAVLIALLQNLFGENLAILHRVHNVKAAKEALMLTAELTKFLNIKN